MRHALRFFSKGAISPAKVRPARNTIAAAVPPLPPLADVATITCTTTKGTVSCIDELGETVRGSRLKELQNILKPIAEAPTLADAKLATPKDISVKAPEVSKAESKPVSDTLEPEAKVKPAVSTTPAPQAKPAVDSERKVEPTTEAKPAVVADKKPEAPVAKLAVSDATKPELKTALATEAPKPAAEPKVFTESKPAQQVRCSTPQLTVRQCLVSYMGSWLYSSPRQHA
ncbi:MAG: hypothetical protein HC767_12895 [Akkermansiaceae bacterium]|nr:hypothetical protein [Akkermansiaceae bacterium]